MMDPRLPGNSPLDSDADNLNSDAAVLRARVEYDQWIGVGGGDPNFEHSDAGFAKIVRLMHDAFSTEAPADTNQSTEGRASIDEIPVSLPDPFGRFEQPRFLGRGVFGSVWRAVDPQLQRDVALKVPHAEMRFDAQFSSRFLREARAAARLNHPSIVRVHEAGLIDGIPYLASEFVAGESLSDRLHKQHRLTPTEAAIIVRQLADAADHAHRSHVVHRDIKPDNVLLTTASENEQSHVIARLTDFGLARLADEDCDLSRRGLLVGTPNYMAPEQFSGADSSRGASVDIYALGVLLYELITGTLPRDSNQNVLGLLAQSFQIQPPRLLFASVPRDLDAICMHCLHVEPTMRYRSAAELRDDLGRFLDGNPTCVRPLGTVESLFAWCLRHRSATVLIATVFFFLCMAIAMMGMWRLESERQNQRLAAALKAGEHARRAAVSSEQKYREISWNTGIQHAYRLYDESDFLAAHSMLQRLAASHPHASYRPEWRLLQLELASQFTILHHAKVPLREVATVPESNLIAIAGDQQQIQLIDGDEGKIHASFFTNLQHVDALTVEPNGRRIAVGGAPNFFDRSSPVLINVGSGQTEPVPLAGPSTIESLKFSPSGKFLATGFRYDGIAVTDVSVVTPTGDKIVQRLEGDRRNLSIAWTDDDQLISQPSFETLRILPLDGTDSRTVTRSHGFQAFAKFPNDTRIAAAFYHDLALEVIELNQGQTEFYLVGAISHCHAVAISADGRLVAAGQNDGQVLFWRLDGHPSTTSPLDLRNHERDLAPIAKIQTHEGAITSLCWQENSVVSVGEDGRVVRLCLQHESLTSIDKPWLTAAEFVPDSDQLLLGFGNGEVWRLDASRLVPEAKHGLITDIYDRCQLNGQALVEQSGFEITALAVSDDTRLFAVCSIDGKIDVRRFADHQSVFSSRRLQPAQNSQRLFDEVDFGPNGTYVYWTGDDNHFNGQPLNDNSPAFAVKFESDVECLRMTSDGRYLAIGGQFEGIRLVESKTGNRVGRAIGVNSLPALSITDDDSMIAGGRDGTIRRFSLASGMQRGIWKPHFSQICALICASDGEFGISLDDAANISLWNPRAGLIYGRLSAGSKVHFDYSHTRGTAIANELQNLWLTLVVRRRGDVIDTQMRLFDLR